RLSSRVISLETIHHAVYGTQPRDFVRRVLRACALGLLQSPDMSSPCFADKSNHWSVLRAVCALSAVAALAYCAYAGGQTRGAPPAAQAPRGGVTLKVIRLTVTTGKPT